MVLIALLESTSHTGFIIIIIETWIDLFFWIFSYRRMWGSFDNV